MISPTVGRIVWFRDQIGPPLAAIVTAVHSDRLVNLCVFERDGWTFSRSNIPLMQDGDDLTWPYCEWMPYQKGQAAKTEQLEQFIPWGLGDVPKGLK